MKQLLVLFTLLLAITVHAASPTNEQLLKVFSNTACSELQPKVKKSDIKALPVDLQIVATELQKGSYQGEFRIQSYKAYSDPQIWAKRNMTNVIGALDNATGIFTDSAQKVTIMVGDTHGADITVECIDKWNVKGDSFTLKKGYNEIVTPKGGLLYVKYFVEPEALSAAMPIDIHIVGGTVNGYFDVEVHKTDEQWARLLKNATYSHFNVRGKHVMWCFHTDMLRQAIPTAVLDPLSKWDSIVMWQWQLMGIDKNYPKTFNNHHYCISNESGYMSATEFFTQYEKKTILNITDPERMFLKRDIMWGPSHEIGHQNDDAITWHGYTEASNNTFSNLSTWKFGKFGTRGPGVNLLIEYGLNRAYPFVNFAYHTPQIKGKGPKYVIEGLFLEMRLGWQLYLYYHAAEKNPDFYPQLFQLLKAAERFPREKADEQGLQFYEKVCQAAGEDLTDFFRMWGFLTPMPTKIIPQYGDIEHTITQDMIDQAISNVKAKNYPKAAPIEYIEDRTTLVGTEDKNFAATLGQTGNYKLYRENAKISPDIRYIVQDGMYEVTGGENAVAYEMRSKDGKLLFAWAMHKFAVPAELSPDATLYAVQADGQRIEIPILKLEIRN